MKVIRLIAFGLLLGTALCNLASAQSLAGCSGINQTSGPKVVLDKLEYKSEAGEIKVLTEEFRAEFYLELLSKLQNLFSGTYPKPVLCANRAPKVDGSDFIPDLVTTLNNRDVLLELWGEIKSAKKDGKQTLGASILMIIIPVRYYESSEQLDFHVLYFPKMERGDLETASKAMAFGTEFDVYTSIANGLKELKNDYYDKAKKYFSNARIQWQEALDGGSLAVIPSEQNRILEYIKRLEKETIAEAAEDPNYKGDLVAITDILEE